MTGYLGRLCQLRPTTTWGGAERLIGIMKRQLKSKIEHSHMNFNELLLTLQEIGKILNNRPLAVENAGSLEHWRS